MDFDEVKALNHFDLALVHRSSPEKHELEESEKSQFPNPDDDIEEDEPPVIGYSKTIRQPRESVMPIKLESLEEIENFDVETKQESSHENTPR